MKNKRLFFLGGIVLFCVALVFFLVVNNVQNATESSLAPFYQTFGEGGRVLNKTLGRLYPVDEMEEAEYGAILKADYNSRTNTSSRLFLYLNSIMSELQKDRKKPFSYTVFPINSRIPNAFALPGGVICVTRPLLSILESENQLAAILAHEMGHIELSHCFDLVRNELLGKKLGNQYEGKLVDELSAMFIRTAFSKTLENEADEFAFSLLKKSKYDPRGLAGSFICLKKYSAGKTRTSQEADLIRDYLLSHPPLEIRIETFSSKAEVWWTFHPNKLRYTGKKNLQTYKSLQALDYGPREWTGK